MQSAYNYIFIGYLFVSMSLSACKDDKPTSIPTVTPLSSEDSLRQAFFQLQGKMDSLMRGLSFSDDISSDGYQFDKLKESVFVLINYEPTQDDYNFGTACVVDSSGIALSNYHVISEYPEIVCIKPGDSIQIGVQVLDSNKDLDYVILQLDPKYGPYTPLMKALNMPKEGADVFAIGHPKGLSFTLTKGIVSAYRDGDTYIQIDAAISSGNSGGPLLNKKGELVGINSFKFYDGESLNFALNINSIPYQNVQHLSNKRAYIANNIDSSHTVTPLSSTQGPNEHLCIDKALRAYSNTIIDFSPNMLLGMCGEKLNRFNDKNNVNTVEIRNIVSTIQSSMIDYRLFDKELEWEDARYIMENNKLIGVLDGILAYKTKADKIVNTHIQMTVKLTADCQLSEVYYITINSF